MSSTISLTLSVEDWPFFPKGQSLPGCWLSLGMWVGE